MAVDVDDDDVVGYSTVDDEGKKFQATNKMAGYQNQLKLMKRQINKRLLIKKTKKMQVIKWISYYCF